VGGDEAAHLGRGVPAKSRNRRGGRNDLPPATEPPQLLPLPLPLRVASLARQAERSDTNQFQFIAMMSIAKSQNQFSPLREAVDKLRMPI
jgi:hypothetical protein